MSPSVVSSLPVQARAWETRTRILDAAVACLADVGYARATTSAILERAGVSRGSLLHQFPSKDELLVAAFGHLAEALTKEFINRPPRHDRAVRLAGEAGRPGDDIEHAVETLWASLHGPLFTATMELWVAARTSPGLREALRSEEHQLGPVVREGIAAVFGADHAAHPRFRELSSLLWSSMRGIALTYTFEPRDPRLDPHLATWKDLAHTYLVIPPANSHGGRRGTPEF